MQRHRSKLNQEGFSILEVMIAAAIAGVIAVVSSQMISQNAKSIKNVELAIDVDNAFSMVRLLFSLKVSGAVSQCACNMREPNRRGSAGTPLTFTSNPIPTNHEVHLTELFRYTLNSAPTATTFADQCTSTTRSKVLEEGTIERNVKTESIILKNFQLNTTVGMDKTYTADLEINLKKSAPGAPAGSSSPDNIKKIFMVLTVNGSNQITQCLTSPDELWADSGTVITPKSGSRTIKAEGGLIIPTTAPTGTVAPGSIWIE